MSVETQVLKAHHRHWTTQLAGVYDALRAANAPDYAIVSRIFEPMAQRIDTPLILLCHKLYRTILQQGHRSSCLAIAQAICARNVGMESATWRCARPAAPRHVMVG